MLLVVVLHTFNMGLSGEGAPNRSLPVSLFLEDFLADGVCRSAVPMFFAISGYLFFADYEHRWSFYARKIRKRIWTLFIPYVLWGLLSLLVCLAVQESPLGRHVHLRSPVREYGVRDVLFTIFCNPVAYQLWYIRDLLAYVAASWIMGPALRRSPVGVLVLLTGLWLAGPSFLFARAFISPTGLLFFCIGASLRIHGVDVTGLRGGGGVAAWLVLVMVKAVLTTAWGRVSVGLMPAIVLAGVFAIWHCSAAVACLIRRFRLEALMVTFFLYATHEPIADVMRQALEAWLGLTDATRVVSSALSAVFAVSTSTALGILLRRRLPRVYGILTGGRA